MKEAVLFLNGRYGAGSLARFVALCRGKYLVAVDGGYAFFRKSGLVPNLLIGDFDSLKRVPKNLTHHTQVIRFPVKKDKTDVELALDVCLQFGAKRVALVQPSFGEPDQFIGNLMLPLVTARRGKRVPIAIYGPDYEIRLAVNETITIAGARGDGLSVVPVTGRIRLSCSGTEYAAQRVEIRPGETRGLRNSITAGRALVRVMGKALVIRRLQGRD